MEIYSKKIRALEKLVKNQNKLLEEIKNLERTYKCQEAARTSINPTNVPLYFLKICLKSHFIINRLFIIFTTV